ncbi:MAG: carboxypeptidase-like regulatory domain-containing protein [Gemmatimonadetes bacterium]|nr:carboxypeptidase-like regulatory domain-containing protein [Gemmatimonadota bacterium]
MSKAVHAAIHLTTLVLLAHSTPLGAQDSTVTLFGTLLDSASAAPIPGATVYVDRWIIGGWTNELGEFRLADLQRGPHTLTLRKSGFLPRSFRLTIAGDLVGDLSLGDITLQATVLPPVPFSAVVVDSLTGEPLASALVGINGTVVATSDEQGRFSINSVDQGQILLDIRRIGYTPITAEVQVRDGPTGYLRFALPAAPFQLDAIVVEGKRATYYGFGRMRAFAERRRRGIGKTFTRSEIEAAHPFQLSDLMRRVSGARVTSRFGRNRVSFRNCGSPDIYIDGMLIRGQALDDVMPIENVGAVEVYNSSASIPAEFLSLRACAVIVIWTR